MKNDVCLKKPLKQRFSVYVKKGNLSLDLLFLPGLIFLIIFNIIPLYGILIGFVDFIPTKGIFGSDWVGLENFKYMFSLPDFGRVVWNTFKIATLKMLIGFPIPIIFALMLNELRVKYYKKTVQTLVYLPYFLSWVIMAGIVMDIFGLDGIINQAISAIGIDPIFFLGDNNHFVPLLLGTEVWKGFGWGTVIYLAALTNVDPTLYEAAVMDGASRWKQTLKITIPSIMPIVILNAILNLGNVLNAGFDQIFNLYSPQVYHTADIIDTYAYRLAFEGAANWSMSTCVGLSKGIVSAVLISIAYYISYKHSDYRVF